MNMRQGDFQYKPIYFQIAASLWNVTEDAVTVPPQSRVTAIGQLKTQISQLRDLMRSWDISLGIETGSVCLSLKFWKTCHDDVIKWKHFPRYWPFVREFTGHRWIPLTKASDAELWCILSSVPEKRLRKQLWGLWFETPSHSLWRHCHVKMFIVSLLTSVVETLCFSCVRI